MKQEHRVSSVAFDETLEKKMKLEGRTSRKNYFILSMLVVELK